MGTEPATPRPLADIIDCPLPTLDIFDIGAMLEDGRDHYDALVAQNLARVTGLEPKQVALDRLTQRAGPYRYFPLFLGDGGTATCHFTHYTGCSSLFEPDPAIIGLFETMGAWEGWDFHVIKAERVRATRLDDLRDEIRADYIKIDVQGAELLVCASAHITWLMGAQRLAERTGRMGRPPTSTNCGSSCATSPGSTLMGTTAWSRPPPSFIPSTNPSTSRPEI
jgi:FkbM family methyltransferase